MPGDVIHCHGGPHTSRDLFAVSSEKHTIKHPLSANYLVVVDTTASIHTEFGVNWYNRIKHVFRESYSREERLGMPAFVHSKK